MDGVDLQDKDEAESSTASGIILQTFDPINMRIPGLLPLLPKEYPWRAFPSLVSLLCRNSFSCRKFACCCCCCGLCQNSWSPSYNPKCKLKFDHMLRIIILLVACSMISLVSSFSLPIKSTVEVVVVHNIILSSEVGIYEPNRHLRGLNSIL